MAKEVTHAVKFRDPVQPSFGPDRELYVLSCDDNSIYEFQKLTDDRIWTLRSRGERSTNHHDWSQRASRLPADVEDTLDELVGEDFWQ